MDSFESLECWRKGREIRMAIAKLCRKLPDFERNGLRSQMTRCSRSVTNNIAEGFGRFHFKENVQFCRIARGSLHELIDHCMIAWEEEYVGQEEYNELKEKITNCLQILNGYIRYLLKQSEKSK